MISEDHDAHVATYLSAKKYFARDQQEKLITAEKNALADGRLARREADETFPWTGLALSGGGIRSATFSLGVLQALARHGLLRHFDYISTVSGGGYIGASLQWWWSQGQCGVGPQSFPYGPGSVGADEAEPRATKDQRSKLAFLNAHGKYLIPGQGINIWSALAVVIRTVLLSVLVWVPLLTALCFLALLADFHVVDPIVSAVLRQPQISHPAIPSPFVGLIAKPEPNAKTSRQNGSGPSNADAGPAAKDTDTAKEKNESAGKGGKAAKDDKTAAGESTKAGNDEAAAKVREALTAAFALRTSHALLHWLVLLGAAVFAVVALLFALLSGAAEKPSRKGLGSWLSTGIGVACLAFVALRVNQQALMAFKPLDWAVVILMGLLGITFIGRTVLTMFDRGQQLLTSMQARGASGSYYLRRGLERQFGRWFVPWFVVAALGAIPLLPLYAISSATEIGSSWHLFAAVFSILSGAVSALYGYYLKLKNWKPGLAGQIFAPVGAALFLLGTLTTAYTLSVFAIASSTNEAPLLDAQLGGAKGVIQLSLVALVILAVLIGTLASLNHVGLHRFYRDRLMEVFMPSLEAVTTNRVSYSPEADLLNVSDLQAKGDVATTSARLGYVPYPLVNAFAFLTDSQDGRVEQRGGDNFLISPLFVGSRVTGWRKTNDYCDVHGPLTLATAMAVSGAAINSNAGYIGTGITRDHLVSAVMTILNMRLGVWIGNPMRDRPALRKTPTYLLPMLTSGLFATPTESSWFVELSDGGNFENLGIYELIRRRVSVILVVDGEADSTLAFPALVSAINRVKEDFRATIRLSSLQGPDQLLPSASLTGYPAGAQFAKSPFMIGEISYEDSKKGVLIYIKSTLIKELDFTTYGYRAGSSDFPHEGTEDQFFSQAQFEAYRNLGFVSAERMIAETKMASWINSGEDPPVRVAGL
jgi:patatin-like phospholipase